jgi:hypothetical protein
MAMSGVQQHARLRLAAQAVIGRVVWAHPDVIETDFNAYRFVNLIDNTARLTAARDVGLIGHHDQLEPGHPQAAAALDHTGQNDKFNQ